MNQGIRAEEPPAAKRTAQNPLPASSPPAPFKEQSITPCGIGLLTGGGDKPYVLGLTRALTEAGLFVEIIGSDELSVPELLNDPNVNFLNLRGDQRPEVGQVAKVLRVLRYYARLVRYAVGAKPKIFHILWHNKFEFFDRTLLVLFYKFLGKRVIFTAHNVNVGERDGNDSFRNRLSLKIQYRLCDHVFVHTEKMKNELRQAFGVAEQKVSVIPFGINKTVRETNLSSGDAKRRLGIDTGDRTLLFFGQIAPYKGLSYVVSALSQLESDNDNYRLIIAGKPKWSGAYWVEVKRMITASGVGKRILKRIEHIPDEETEVYFKAADVLVLPYTDIFQSGVLFLGYNFGLPAVVTDVGSLKEHIIEGKTGFVCRPRDSSDLAATIRRYFGSSLFHELDHERSFIKAFANEHYSWSRVATITKAVYQEVSG